MAPFFHPCQHPFPPAFPHSSPPCYPTLPSPTLLQVDEALARASQQLNAAEQRLAAREEAFAAALAEQEATEGAREEAVRWAASTGP